MPIKSGKLTPQERVFVDKYAMTGDSKYAAEKAGYVHPIQRAHTALARPAIQAEIARVQTERLYSVALPAAVQCLEDIVSGDKYPAGARVQAAKVILDRTLGADGSSEAKEPHEMTADELARQIDKLKREASNRAKPILEGETLSQSPSVLD